MRFRAQNLYKYNKGIWKPAPDDWLDIWHLTSSRLGSVPHPLPPNPLTSSPQCKERFTLIRKEDPGPLANRSALLLGPGVAWPEEPDRWSPPPGCVWTLWISARSLKLLFDDPLKPSQMISASLKQSCPAEFGLINSYWEKINSQLWVLWAGSPNYVKKYIKPF